MTVVLLSKLGVIILAATSIFLVRETVRDKVWPYIKRDVIVINVCLIILTFINILFYIGGRVLFDSIDSYIRVAITILWLLFAYEVVYVEVAREARRRKKELEALDNIAIAVGQSMDTDQILQNALQSVTKIGNFDIGFVYLLDDEKKLLNLAASYGSIPNDLAEKLSQLQLGQEV